MARADAQKLLESELMDVKSEAPSSETSDFVAFQLAPEKTRQFAKMGFKELSDWLTGIGFAETASRVGKLETEGLDLLQMDNLKLISKLSVPKDRVDEFRARLMMYQLDIEHWLRNNGLQSLKDHKALNGTSLYGMDDVEVIGHLMPDIDNNVRWDLAEKVRLLIPQLKPKLPGVQLGNLAERYALFLKRKTFALQLAMRLENMMPEPQLKAIWKNNQTKFVGRILRQKKLPLIVRGVMKSGKSSLLNALLGLPDEYHLFPASKEECTARLVRLVYGAKREYRLVDSKTEKPIEGKSVSLAGLNASETQRAIEGAVKLTGVDRKSTLTDQIVEICWDLPLLEHGIEIVDAPGASENSTLDDLLRRYLDQQPHVAMIYVINSRQNPTLTPEVRHDLESTCSSLPRNARVLFAVTFMDAADNAQENSRIAEKLLKELGEVGNGQFHYLRDQPVGKNDYFHCVSSTDALRSAQDKQPQPRSFVRLQESVVTFISAQFSYQILRLCSALRSSLDALIEVTADKKHDYEDLKARELNLFQELKQDIWDDARTKEISDNARKVIEDNRAIWIESLVKMDVGAASVIGGAGGAKGNVRELTAGNQQKIFEELEKKFRGAFWPYVTEWYQSITHRFNRRLLSLMNDLNKHLHRSAEKNVFLLGNIQQCYSVPPLLAKKLEPSWWAKFREWLTPPTFDEDWKAKETSKIIDLFVKKQSLEETAKQFQEVATAAATAAHKNFEKRVEQFEKAIKEISDSAKQRTKERLPKLYEIATFLLALKFDVESDQNPIRRQDFIGRGYFGQVYGARWRGQEVALKCPNPPNDKEPPAHNQSIYQRLCLEAYTLSTFVQSGIKHPNIVLLYGVNIPKLLELTLTSKEQLETFRRNRPIELVLERLMTNLETANVKMNFSVTTKIQLSLQIARGLAVMHHYGILHRDLKPDNVMLDEQYTAKIGDFGLATISSNHGHYAVGNYETMAPETRRGLEYSYSADIYALGVTIWMIMSNTTSEKLALKRIDAAWQIPALSEPSSAHSPSTSATSAAYPSQSSLLNPPSVSSKPSISVSQPSTSSMSVSSSSAPLDTPMLTAAVHSLLEKCTMMDPKLRLSAADVAVELAILLGKVDPRHKKLKDKEELKDEIYEGCAFELFAQPEMAMEIDDDEEGGVGAPNGPGPGAPKQSVATQELDQRLHASGLI